MEASGPQNLDKISRSRRLKILITSLSFIFQHRFTFDIARLPTLIPDTQSWELPQLLVPFLSHALPDISALQAVSEVGVTLDNCFAFVRLMVSPNIEVSETNDGDHLKGVESYY